MSKKPVSIYQLSAKPFHAGLMIILGILTLLGFFFLRYSIRDLSSETYSNIQSQKVFFQSDPLITVPAHIKSPVPIFSLDPYRGNPQSDVAVVLFGNYEDQGVRNVLQNLEDAYHDSILIIWKDLISPDDENAMQMALQAHCASLQKKFWPFTEKLLDQKNAASAISELGLDENQLSECVEGEGFENLIEESYYYSNSLGLTKAPWLYVNQNLITNIQDMDFIKQTIQNELH